MAVSPPLPGMLHIPLVYIRAFALVSHVSVEKTIGCFDQLTGPSGPRLTSWLPAPPSARSSRASATS